MTNEFSKFAEEEIMEAINYLNEYLGTKYSEIIEKRTYDIKLPNGSIKCGSYKTKFIKDHTAPCTVEVSNPFNTKGARYWTFFRGKGGYWTNKEVIKDVSSELVFNLLSHNHEWIYKKVHILRDRTLSGELSTEEYAEDLMPFVLGLSELSPDIIESYGGKEELAFKVFERVFRKQVRSTAAKSKQDWVSFLSSFLSSTFDF